MSKPKTAFFCQNCGAQYSKWSGKCTSCNEWNTIVEELIVKDDGRKLWETESIKISRTSKPQPINSITQTTEQRLLLPDKELNRVLGSGLVAGSLVLLGGEPGIGKSTILLQLDRKSTR